MRRILVTGANKGIGLAIAEGVLAQHTDTFLLLGARDRERGRKALQSLIDRDASYAGRSSVVEIDVAREDSVSAAAELVGGEGSLHALVNNAGVGFGVAYKDILSVNAFGTRRVTEALLPHIDPDHGRIVHTSSAAGPNFVSNCSPERQRFFLDPDTEWADLEALIEECMGLNGNTEAFEQLGLGDGAAYGLSKACVNTYTLQLARRCPALKINACTPGFIDTDLTRAYATAQGKQPSELGMKTPADGARCPLHLLFEQLDGNGRYYGSDCVRSPLDRYRAPGDPPYAGA